MERIIRKRRYNTETSEKIGECVFSDFVQRREVLYRTDNGRLFLTFEKYDEQATPPFYHAELRTCSMPQAYVWAANASDEVLARLKELYPPKPTDNLVLLADYRCGSPAEAKTYVHQVIFGTPGGADYFIASNHPIDPLHGSKEPVSVSGTEGVEAFCEDMYIDCLTEEEAKAWAEDCLPVDIYIRCFGPVEDA